MGSVVIDMSMSLDGYIAAPNDNPEQGLGKDGMRLHNWAFEDPSVAERVYGKLVEETGAVIMGRRSYDNSIQAWGGKGPLGDVPCFVVTHKPPASSDPVFTFVTDGIQSALAKAREVAAEKRIGLMGAKIDQQFLATGLVTAGRCSVRREHDLDRQRLGPLRTTKGRGVEELGSIAAAAAVSGPAPLTPSTGPVRVGPRSARHDTPAATPRLIASRSAMLRHRTLRRGGCRCTPPLWRTKAHTDGPRLPSLRTISGSESPCRHRGQTSSCSAADSPQ